MQASIAAPPGCISEADAMGAAFGEATTAERKATQGSDLKSSCPATALVTPCLAS